MLDVIFSAYCWMFVAGWTAFVYVVGSLWVHLATSWWDETRSWSHKVCELWARSLIALSPQWRAEAFDLDRLPRDRPVILISNHQGMGDIMLVYQLRTQFRWIAKEILFKVPFLGWSMAHSGYIALRRGDKNSIRDCMTRARWYLDRGVALLFFPEGTRSKDGTLLPFKAGAFKLAIESGCDLVPLGIAGAKDALPTNSWKYPRRRSWMRIKVGDPISPRGYTEADIDKLIEVSRTAIAQLKADLEAMDPSTEAAPTQTAPAR